MSGVGSWLICLVALAFYSWGIVCGLFLLEARPGAERMNLHLWFAQVPMFASPLATNSLSSGFYAGALLQIDPFKLNVDARIGSTFRRNLLHDGTPFAIGINVAALTATCVSAFVSAASMT